MKVLTFEPGKDPEYREIDGSLESMQEIVGGYIEAVDLPEGLVLVCNEEGKLENLNPSAELDVAGMPWDLIRGTCFVCRRDEDRMVGLEDGDEERISEYVRPARRKEAGCTRVNWKREKAPAGREE